ncbi:uncharacterized protein LOC143211627 [Lasioglossum baleicum]|uniref:uncharacterized protein LOC143211627 n=1 Tax=Lasioglossum baleicum TaxID=434251 RepID=UPI003FCE270D
MVYVRKIECTNHLLRNFSKRIDEIAEKDRFKELRTIVKNNAYRLRTGILAAAKRRFEEELSRPDQVRKLKGDLKNVPSHVFGEHKKCRQLAYFCQKCDDPKEINHVPQLKEAGMLIGHAGSLLHRYTNNIVECLNSLIAKLNGGKRINNGRKGSYQARVNAAVVQFNSKEVVSRLCAAMGKEPTAIVKKLEQKRKHKAEMTKKYKRKQKQRLTDQKHSDAIRTMAPMRRNRTWMKQSIIQSWRNAWQYSTSGKRCEKRSKLKLIIKLSARNG